MDNSKASIQRLKSAVKELKTNRHLFSEESYAQIVLALNDRLRVLQTRRTADNTILDTGDEIRQVTVMFVDVKDSTEIANRIGDENYKLVIREAHRRLGDVLEQWDGEIGQYLGDGLLCFFGAHRSRGDDAQRAVACALDIQTIIGSYARELSKAHNVEFMVRIGISTGRVIVGLIGSEDKNEFLALGTTTNLAARLQDMAAPGSILIDEPTHQRVRWQFIVREQTPASVKGFEAPIQHYAVIRRRRVQEINTQEIGGVAIPFVGREWELEQILAALHMAVREGPFRVITVRGDIGVGKTRLLETLLGQIGDLPVQVIMVSPTPEKRASSYALLRSLLATTCSLTNETPTNVAEARIVEYVTDVWDDEDAEVTAAVMGYLAGYGFADSDKVAQLRQSTYQQRVIAHVWVANWFRVLAEQKPLLLIIDNIHWLDRASIELLEYVINELDALRGALLATSNLDFAGTYPSYMSPLADRHTRILLEPLPEKQTQALVETLLVNVESQSPALIAAIVERTEGNPLFIEELLRMLYDSGIFEPTTHDTWRLNSYLFNTMFSTLPTGLLGILQARLDDLTIGARQVVQVASVVGQQFWDVVVSRLTGFDTRSVLDDLVLRGILIRLPESSFEGTVEYAFRLALYRQTAYEMLTHNARKNYHRQIAQWLSGYVSLAPEYLPLLGEHYTLAGQNEQALGIYHLAVEDRIARGLPLEALRLVDAGLHVARDLPRVLALPTVSQLWVAQGRTLITLHRYEEASAACQSALMLLDELQQDELHEARVTAACTLGNAFRCIGRYMDALSALQRAYDLLPKDGGGLLATVLHAFGRLAYYRGYLNESRAYQQRALSAAERSGEAHHIAGALTELGLIALEHGDVLEALRSFEQVLARNRQNANIYFQTLDLLNIGNTYAAARAYDLALAAYDQAAALQLRLQVHEPLLHANRGLCLVALGRADDGMRLLETAVEQAPRDHYKRQITSLLLLNGLVLAGDYERCYELGLSFTQEAQQHNPLIYARGLLWLGIAQSELGDADAVATLKNALSHELEYGGLYAWQCHAALAHTSRDKQEVQTHYHSAAQRIRALAKQMSSRAELQRALLDDPLAREILRMTK